ncbi:MAG: ABC transporter permease [Chloroflexi bacterium]|nr:MAG: ABC transporter permease [Chloroflexota bacterium]
MISYIVRRLLQAIPTIFGVTLISFIIMQAAPGDPVQLMTFNPSADAEDRARLEQELCLDRSLPEQYFIWLFGDLRGECAIRGLIRGDFGTSFYDRRPVIEMIGERLPATLELTATALVMGGVIGLIVGVLSAVNRASAFDNIARFFSVVFDAIPSFWLGLLLIMYFSVELRWLPVGGRLPLNVETITFTDRFRHLAMPSTVLAVTWIALMSRYMRAETLEVIRQDYIRTARAKGVPKYRVYFYHAARNAHIPIVTILGPAITGLVAGAVVIERIFSWPGLGRLTVDAVSARDYPIVTASVIIGSILVIIGNLLSDILLALVDPRLRLGLGGL